MDNEPIFNFKSLKDQVYDYLRGQLYKENLKPGSQINLDKISKQLGISKTPLRDALIRLEMEGFVTILPRRGVMVNVLTHREIEQFYQIIGALESSAILSAFSNIDQNAIKKMEELNNEMREAIRKDDFNLYYDKNLQFHDIYLDLCGNDLLKRTAVMLKKRLYDFPRQKSYVKEWEEASILEHAELVKLIRDGKMIKSARFVRDVHWSYRVQEKYIKRYYPDYSDSGFLRTQE